MSQKRIGLIGECMIELNGEPFGEMTHRYGGDVLNCAVYLARAAAGKIEVHFVSAMGGDPLSQEMIRRWQTEGVHTDQVLIDPLHQPGLYLIQLDTKGERTFLYWRNNSAAHHLLHHPRYPELLKQLSGMDVIFISGITLAILSPQDRRVLLRDLRSLAQQGITMLFDSNYRPALWHSPQETRDCYQAMYALTDLALVTNEDEAALWGDSHAEETFERLRQSGVKQAIIKAGAEGCDYRDLRTTSAVRHIPTTPVPCVIDTTSAGDAFNAGFLAGYLTGCDTDTAARMGHQLAGVVIRHKGAIIPDTAIRPVTDSFFQPSLITAQGTEHV
ncbi:MAG: 2-dehydro-3-deoxygluconokinase [Candidatus Erwinia impunctatus]|nr:2-dehydro-3-deoxygluconokinase [Culicoides impunctatus]